MGRYRVVKVTISRRTIFHLAAASSVLSTAVGCAASHSGTLPERDITQPDLNPYPRSAIAHGGNLSVYLDQSVPNNWNFYHIDGYRLGVHTFNNATMPVPMLPDKSNQPQWNPDYLLYEPRKTIIDGRYTIQYTLKPGMHYSDGSSVTWRDFWAIWYMNNGHNRSVNAAVIAGYDHIESVVRGNTDQEVIVTFAKPYGDWRALFPILYPAHALDSVEKFNSGWLTRLPPTCGPFRLRSFNRNTEILIVERDPNWQGIPALLDTITFFVVDISTSLTAFKNGTLDAVPVVANSDLATILSVPDVKVRKALSSTWYFLGFNAGSDRITQELGVRQALQQAVNTDFIREVMAGSFAKKIPRLGNHIYLVGQDGYQDNAIPYNPKAAAQLLDHSGWKLHTDGVRYRDGKKLTLKILSRTDNFRVKLISQLVQYDLIKIGVQAVIQAVPSVNFYPDYFLRGNFDLVVSAWVQDAGMVSASRSIYSLYYTIDPKTKQKIIKPESAQNCGVIGSEEINKLYTKALAISDLQEQARVANEIDKKIWEIAHSLPLYQVIEGTAMIKNIANYGEPLLGSIQWRDIGYVKD